MKKLILLVTILSFTIIGWAQASFEVGGIKYTTTGENTVEVSSKYPNYLGSITIPSTAEYSDITYSVTSIGDRAFDGCRSLTSITIPTSVTSIGDYAFQGCKSLTSVTIPSSVTSIVYLAFSYCTAFINVDLNNPNYSSKDGVLYNKDQSTLIQCPISISGSFSIPSSVTSIGESAFLGCSSLTSVTIPSSVTSIGEEAFRNCSAFISVEANNLNYSSKDGVLYNKDQSRLIQCPISTSGTFFIPTSVTSIGNYAFRDCTSLTSVTIPSSVTSIGNEFFLGCTSLTSVTIPSSVTSIGYYAFCDCTSLTSVTIPSSVTSIGDRAFHLCTSLTSIIIPSSVTSIGGGAFQGCKSLTSVIIPSSVTSIGGLAFYDCTSLTSIIIPSSVTSIGDGAFQGCKSLTSVIIPSSVTSIGDGAFDNCSAFINVDSNNPNYSSKDGVLYNKDQSRLIQCPISTSGTFFIPSSVTSIGGSAFYNCTSLTSVNIPSLVTSIGRYAFVNCTSLSTIKVNSSTPPTLGSNVFSQVDKSNCTLYVPTGSFSVYKTANQWKDFINIIEFTPTGIENGTIPTLNLYPNPTRDYINISGIQDVIIKITDMNGKLIVNQKLNGNDKIDLQNFLSGVYHYRIESPEGVQNGKIIKE